jgi:dihydroflavonol-4-reductase
MILDAAAGRTPAYVDTGLNIVHVDDVAEGHMLALERGRLGERYILGGENLTLQALLTLIAQVVGRRPPAIRLPLLPLWPVALAMEALGRVTRFEPRLTSDTLRMARKKMFYSSAKAMHELAYAPRPARQAIEDAVTWLRAERRLSG